MPDASFNKIKAFWFFIRKLTIILVVGLLVYYVYSVALKITNVYVVASDGMHELAAQALMKEENASLGDFFSQDIIDDKQAVLTQHYTNCTIWDFKYNLKIEPFICLPASNSVTITATEIIRKIDGVGETIDKEVQPIPAWDNAKYKITLQKNSRGQWIITKLDMIEDLEDTDTSLDSTASPAAID